MSFLGELKKRKVIQVAVAYAIIAWGLVEVVSTVEEPLGLPPWTDTLVIVLVLIGFPMALLLSWAFDLTPKGIVRAEPMQGSTSPSSRRCAMACARPSEVPGRARKGPNARLEPARRDPRRTTHVDSQARTDLS